MADDYAPIFSPPDIDYSVKKRPNEPKPVLPPIEATPAINPRIFELENKPKTVLAHDKGAGSPCLNCDHCPTGLDLHFWRKLCRTCKCKKEDHDVHDLSEDPGKILIGRLFDRPIDHSPKDKAAYTVRESSATGPHQSSTGKRWTGKISETRVANGAHSDVQQKLEGKDSSPKLPSLLPTPPSDKDSHGVEQKYEWIPPATTAELVARYMEMLPKEHRPIQGTEGAVKRRKALEYQFPLHDCDPAHMHRKLTEEEAGVMTKYVNVLKSEVVGQGEIQPAIPHLPILPFPPSPDEKENDEVEGVKGQMEKALDRNALDNADSDLALEKSTKPCADCDGPLVPGDVGLFTQHSGPDVCWHPGCFKCCICDQLLVDMLYFFKGGKYYCGRHYGNTAFPRCNGCDELIFAREYTRAEDKDWHLNHFCCFGCDLELGGQKYMVKENQPYCFNCYLSKFAHMCQKCGRKIAPDVKRITHQDSHWHATEECFKCIECGGDLLGKKFVMKNKNVFCSTQCKVQYQEKSNNTVDRSAVRGSTVIY